jgi:hypothetical protein
MFENLKNEYNLTDESLTELVALYQQKYGEILGISQEMLDAMQQSINDAPTPTGGSPRMGGINTGVGVRTPSPSGGIPKGKSATFSGGSIRAQGEATKGKPFAGGSMDVAPVNSQQNIIQLSSGVTIEQVRGIIAKNNDEIMRSFLDVLR